MPSSFERSGACELPNKLCLAFQSWVKGASRMMFGMVSTVSNLAVRASGFEGLTHWLERRADLRDGLSFLTLLERALDY